MKQKNRTGLVRHAAGVAALAVFAVACSGSSDGGAPEISAPVSEVAVAPVTEAPVTVASVVTDPPAAEPAVDPPQVPNLPCAEYVEESGYPLKPCDSGVLVETLQRDLVSLFPGIAIDGLFGNQTFGFIKEFQTSNALEATGLVSEELAGQISTAEALGELGDDASVTTEAAAAASADAATEELCNGLIGNADDPNFTAATIEACSALGIDVVGEG